MADRSPIEWLRGPDGRQGATWNPIVGCSVVSPGCTNCYAMRLAGTRMKTHPSRAGLTKDSKAGPVWTGEVRFMEQWLAQPLRWAKPRMIFVCAHADLFHENVPDEWIDRVFAVMALCPQHTFQVLTKRPERMREYLSRNDVSLLDRWSKAFGPGTFRMSSHELMARLSPFTTPEHRALYHAAYPVFPLPNVWLGVSVEDQRRADERIPILLDTPAAVRWISAEPLLGALDPARLCIAPKVAGSPRAGIHVDALRGRYVESGMPYIGAWDVDGPYPANASPRGLDLVVAGFESGPRARPGHINWARALRDQCAQAGVPFFWKQNGEYEDGGPAWGAAAGSAADLDGYVFVAPDGCVYRTREDAPRGAYAVRRVGKKASGRLLDGVIHDGYPEAPR